MRTALFAFGPTGRAAYDELLRLGHSVVGIWTHAPDAHEDPCFTPVSAPCPTFFHPAHTTLGEDVTAQLESVNPDLLLSVWFRSILPGTALTVPARGAWNFHASLLPSYRGRSPLNWALIRGERRTGVTLHAMTPQVDCGGILDSRPIPITPSDDINSLLTASNAAVRHLLQHNLARIALDDYALIPQHPTDEPPCRARTPEDGWFTWNDPAHSIHNLVRAVTHPFPGAFFLAPSGTQVFVWKTRFVPGCNTLDPGIPVILDNYRFCVGTSDDAVEILVWSKSGGPERPGSDLADAWKLL